MKYSKRATITTEKNFLRNVHFLNSHYIQMSTQVEMQFQYYVLLLLFPENTSVG